MPKLTQAEYDRTHEDFRGTIDGQPHVLFYDPQKGTCLGLVEIVPDDYWWEVVGARTNERANQLQATLLEAGLDVRLRVRGAFYRVEVAKKDLAIGRTLLITQTERWDPWWIEWPLALSHVI